MLLLIITTFLCLLDSPANRTFGRVEAAFRGSGSSRLILPVSLILWLRNPRPQFGILSQPHQSPEAGALGYRSCIPYSIFCVLSVPLRLFSQRARAVRSFGSAVAERHALPSWSYLLPRVLLFGHYLSIKDMHRALRVLGDSAVMGNHANGCSTLMRLGEKLHDCVPVLAV